MRCRPKHRNALNALRSTAADGKVMDKEPKCVKIASTRRITRGAAAWLVQKPSKDSARSKIIFQASASGSEPTMQHEQERIERQARNRIRGELRRQNFQSRQRIRLAAVSSSPSISSSPPNGVIMAHALLACLDRGLSLIGEQNARAATRSARQAQSRHPRHSSPSRRREKCCHVSALAEPRGRE